MTKLFVGALAAVVVIAADGCGATHSAAAKHVGDPVIVTSRTPAPPPGTFLSRWDPPSSGGPVLEEFSLSDGRPLRQLVELPEGVSGPLPGPRRTVWLASISGPRDRNNTAGGDPEPNSCSSVIERVNLATGTTTPVLSFPSSELAGDAMPSPSGEEVVMLAGSCARSYFNSHLLVENLKSRHQWTIGAEAEVCHSLSTPAWNPAGTRLVFVYGPSAVRGRVNLNYGQGICASPLPGELAVLPASGTLPLSKAHLIQPSKGCSYQDAVFDRQGIAAVEGCKQGSPPGFSSYNDGDAYLVQLDRRDHVTLRLGLRRESDVTSLARDPSSGLVFVSESQGENTKPAFDWIWTFNGHRLGAVAHYNENITAEPW